MRLRPVFTIAATVAALVSAVIAPGTEPVAQASTIRISARTESTMVRYTNAARGSYRLHGLRVNAYLVRVAQAHSLRMARENHLYHNARLRYTVSSYRLLGENVGYSTSAAKVQRALMKSPSHRANILNRRFTQVGIGVAIAGDRIWVTEVFRQP